MFIYSLKKNIPQYIMLCKRYKKRSYWCMEMAFEHCLWFWWLNNNIVEGTRNKYVSQYVSLLVAFIPRINWSHLNSIVSKLDKDQIKKPWIKTHKETSAIRKKFLTVTFWLCEDQENRCYNKSVLSKSSHGQLIRTLMHFSNALESHRINRCYERSR